MREVEVHRRVAKPPERRDAGQFASQGQYVDVVGALLGAHRLEVSARFVTGRLCIGYIGAYPALPRLSTM